MQKKNRLSSEEFQALSPAEQMAVDPEDMPCSPGSTPDFQQPPAAQVGPDLPQTVEDGGNAISVDDSEPEPPAESEHGAPVDNPFAFLEDIEPHPIFEKLTPPADDETDPGFE